MNLNEKYKEPDTVGGSKAATSVKRKNSNSIYTLYHVVFNDILE